MKQEVSKKYER